MGTEGHPGASAKRPNHKRVWSQGWGEACLRERVGRTDDEAAGSGRVLTTPTQEVLSHGCLMDSTKQGPAGLNTSKTGQCPEPVLCGPHRLFQKPRSPSIIQPLLAPPSTHASIHHSQMSSQIYLHPQSPCPAWLCLPKRSTSGTWAQSGFCSSPPPLSLYCGRLLIVMEEWP